MESILSFLFSDGGYSPHGFCIAWDWRVLYTHIGADLMIALAYFAIPAILLVFLRKRRDPRLNKPALLFVIFITACGVSHLMSIVTMFLPYYGLQGLIKLFTGLVSVLTAVALWKMMPDALKIPTPDAFIDALADKEAEVRERKKSERALRLSQIALDQKIEALQHSNDELQEFSYAASHDLKAPANTLSLWLQDFKLDCEDDLSPDQLEALDEAEKILVRMRALVDDILSYSRTVNRNEIAPETVDLRAVFERAVADLRDDITKARASIVVHDMPQIKAFPALISVLAQNLLSNAIKFRSPDRPLEIHVSAGHAGGDVPSVVLSVSDNGLGIDPSHHDRIFGLFKRLHRAEDYPGTGLGLSLCRRVAVAHGGTIDVVSTEGAGATFRVTLPVEVVEASRAA